MTNLTVADFTTLRAGSAINTTALVADASIRLTRKNTEYLDGSFGCVDGNIAFKCWDPRTAQHATDMVGQVYNIQGTVNEYNGSFSIIVDNFFESDVDKSEFIQRVYDQDSLTAEWKDIMSRRLSNDGQKLVNALVDGAEGFNTEYAARAAGQNHDNVYNGLLAHSVKCLRVLDSTWDTYTNFHDHVDTDLVFIGTFLHDIGKALEYYEGSISELGQWVSHRTLATEMIARRRKSIVSVFGEEWYYRLMSVFAQHHGEYEEKPRTIEALIVHYVDMYESSMTGIASKVDEISTLGTVRHHGFYIS